MLRGFKTFLFIVAGSILLLGMIAFTAPGLTPRAAAWAAFGGVIGLTGALIGLAMLIGRPQPGSQELRTALARFQQKLTDVQNKLNHLELTSEQVSHVVAAPAPVVEAAPTIDYSHQLELLSAAIADVRRISLLPDADRKQVACQETASRRSELLRDLYAHVASQQWPQAERFLITLETEFPNDDEIARGRSYLENSRRLNEEQSLIRTVEEVEKWVRAGEWNQALDQAQNLVVGFPNNPDARSLLRRVEREKQMQVEADAQRVFEDIRTHIARRSWRRALVHAEKFTQLYPDHRHAEQIRAQLGTLRENAEIEERHELEGCIQQFVHDGRLHDAIELGEDVIRRFPNSPQAESLDQLLPKLRELSQSPAEVFAGLSPDATKLIPSDMSIRQSTTSVGATS